MHPQDYADLCAHLGTAPWATNYYPSLPGGETVLVLFDPNPGDHSDERMAVHTLMYNGRGPDGRRNWPMDKAIQSGPARFTHWEDPKPTIYPTLGTALMAYAEQLTIHAETELDNERE